MKITIDIPPQLYSAMIEQLKNKTLGDALHDPIVMVCAHVREAYEEGPKIEARDDQKA